MSGAATTVEVRDEEVRRVLGRLLDLGRDLRPVTDEIGRTLVKNTELRFDVDQAGPDGTPWLPSLRAKLQGGQTLKDTGRLRQTSPTSPRPRASRSAPTWSTPRSTSSAAGPRPRC
jgi:hypothetical protein